MGDIKKNIINYNLIQTLTSCHITSTKRAQISLANKPPFEGPTTSQALEGYDSTVPWLAVIVFSHALTMSTNEEKDKWF
jgi:hypothetical protein